MSQNNNEARCTKGQSISNPGAFARHKQACETCGESQDGKAIQADDLETSEIAHATANMGEADYQATLDGLGFKPKEADSARTATAKALVDAKGGGKERYTEVFGQCVIDGCEYGANGFEAECCARSDHTVEAPEGSDEPDESEPSDDQASEAPEAETDRATYVKELIDVGVSPVKAEEAATARFDG